MFMFEFLRRQHVVRSARNNRRRGRRSLGEIGLTLERVEPRLAMTGGFGNATVPQAMVPPAVEPPAVAWAPPATSGQTSGGVPSNPATPGGDLGNDLNDEITGFKGVSCVGGYPLVKPPMAFEPYVPLHAQLGLEPPTFEPQPWSAADFTNQLQTLVLQAGLHEGLQELAKPDVLGTFGTPCIGFDCDDFADVMQTYLGNTLTPSEEVDISLVVMTWEKTNGPKVGHVMLAIECEGHYWFVNPTQGVVGGAHSSFETMLYDVYGHLNDTAKNLKPGTIAYEGLYADHQGFVGAKPDEPPAWHHSYEMRNRLWNYLNDRNIDPIPYGPWPWPWNQGWVSGF